MGQGQQTQAARDSGRLPLTPSHTQGSGSFHGLGPIPSGGSTAFSIEGDDKIPVVFSWAHGQAQTVCLAGSFNKWKKIEMVRSGKDFSIVQELPRGVHQFKFIVDDRWECDRDQPKIQDGSGNTNNVIDITQYQRFDALAEDDKTITFAQNIPSPDDYTVDAPAIPAVLAKSPLCALPLRPSIAGGPSAQPPNVPFHGLSDHVYLKSHASGDLVASPDDQGWGAGCSYVAVTHRYGQKYSTTAFVVRSPFCPPGRPVGGPNLLKRIVKRASVKS